MQTLDKNPKARMRKSNENRRGDPKETEITREKKQCFEHNLMSREADLWWDEEAGCSLVGLPGCPQLDPHTR